MSVDGGARHAEEVGDLLHGALAGVVELLREQDLLGRESWPSPAFASAGARGGESVAGVAGGRDVLEGGPGDERLNGGKDPDRIDAGPGDDTVVSVDGARDVIDCGPGRDHVTRDRLDVVRNCEIDNRGG